MDAFTTWALVVIAMVAVFISIWQIFATRKQNRLSVRPNLGRFSNPSDCYGVINNGIGPAKIKSFSLFCQGKEILESDDPKEFINTKNKAGLEDIGFVLHWLDVGDLMPTEKKKIIVQILDSGKISNDVIKNNIKLFIKDIKIKYESMYGVKYDFETDWNAKLKT